ncbi:MAG TPA: DUF4236 domain-containing protein [Thermomicrobiales bacterium]|nr:DUF4236 domain-containing protein [Thermomicrobiales bacterium]
MGFRFRKSFKVAPGVRVNLSKSGIGTSFGVRGARYSVGPRGRRATFSLPGTGLSYQTGLAGSRRRRATAQRGGCCCLGTLLLACAPGALLAPGGAALARRARRAGRWYTGRA